MLDLTKLRIGSFKGICYRNFPVDIQAGIASAETGVDVVIYYVDSLGDVGRFVELCDSLPLPTENRTIMVYRKGRRDGVQRDGIMAPFNAGRYPRYRQRAPMLCSLSEDLSAFVFSRES